MRSGPLVALLLFSPALSAVEPGTLTFDEAIGLAERAPQVEGARQAADAHREIADRISTFTGNPQIVVQPGYRAHPEDRRGIEGTVGIALPWNLGGLSRRRREAAGAEGAWHVAQSRLAALERRLEAARMWITLAGIEQETVIAEEEAALADQLEQRIRRRLEVGEATAQEVARAEAFAAEARLTAIEAAGRRAETALQLARETSDSPTPQLATAGPLPSPPQPARSIDEAFAALEALPTIQVQSLRARVERARAAEVRAAGGGALQVGVFAQKEAPDEYIGYAAFTWTPALLDRGERQRASQEAEATRAEGDARQAAREAKALLALAFHEVEHTAELAEELGGSLVPATREAARLTRELLDQGEETVVEVLRARREAAAARRRQARAIADLTWARVRLWMYLAALEENLRSNP